MMVVYDARKKSLDLLSEKEKIKEELEKLSARHDKLIQGASSKEMQLKSRWDIYIVTIKMPF